MVDNGETKSVFVSDLSYFFVWRSIRLLSIIENIIIYFLDKMLFIAILKKILM